MTRHFLILKEMILRLLGLDTSIQGIDARVQTLETTDSNIKDRIIEIGVTSGWIFRRWASGRTEAWARINLGDATPSTWAAPVRYADFTPPRDNIPAGLFESNPQMWATANGNDQWWVVSCRATSNRRFQARFCTISTGKSNISFDVYAVGQSPTE